MVLEGGTLAEAVVEVSANLAPLERDLAKAKVQIEKHTRDMGRMTARDFEIAKRDPFSRQAQEYARRAREEIANSQRRAAASRQLERQYLAEAAATRRSIAELDRRAAAMRNELLLTNRVGGRRGGGPPIVPIVPLRDAERGIAGVGKASGIATLLVRNLIGALGVGLAYQLANVVTNSLKATAAIKDVAQQTGLTTTELQEFRGIAGQVGLTADQMDQAFVQFHDTLGKVATSATRESKLFDLLGIKLKDAGGHAKTTEQLFGEFVDKMGEVGSESQRTAALALVFGETLGPKMAQLVSQGSEKIDGLREAIAATGIVLSEEEIQKADETARKLEQVKLVLDAKIASTVVANAEAIGQLAEALAEVATTALAAAASMAKFFASLANKGYQIGAPGSRGGTSSGVIRSFASQGYPIGFTRTPDAMGGARGPSVTRTLGTAKPGTFYDPSNLSLSEFGGTKAKAGGGIDLSSLFARKGRGGGGGKQAPENIFDREEVQAQQARLRLLRDSTASLERRNEIDRELIDLELREKLIQIDRQQKDGRLTKAQAAQLKAAEEANAQLEREAADRQMREDMVERQSRAAEELATAEEQMLDIALRLARTDEDREKIEASLLQIKQQEELREIDRQITLARIAGDEERIAELTELRRKALERQAGETKAFAEEHLRGIEKFRNELPKTVKEINEQIENIRFDLFMERLQDMARFAEDVGDAFGNAAGRIARFENPLDVLEGLLQDLSQTLTEQFIEKPISDWATRNIGFPLAKKTMGEGVVGPDALTVQQMNTALALATQNLAALSGAAAAASAAMGGSAAAGGAGAAAAADALGQSATGTSQSFAALDPQIAATGNAFSQLLSGLAGGGGGGGGGLMSFLKMGLQVGAMALGGGAGGLTAAAPTAFSASALYPGIDPMFLGFAGGGWLGGGGTGQSDSGLFRGSVGEHITNAKAAKPFKPLLDGINSGRIPSIPALRDMMGGGGMVDRRSFSFGDFHFPGVRNARDAREAKRQVVSGVQRELGKAHKAGYRATP